MYSFHVADNNIDNNTTHRHPYCTDNMRKYNYKQLSKLIKASLKLYNTTHYLHITYNTQIVNGMQQREILSSKYILNELTATKMGITLINFNSNVNSF
jgi:hypothetical protein